MGTNIHVPNNSKTDIGVMGHKLQTCLTTNNKALGWMKMERTDGVSKLIY